jgi:hypothetical protein
VWQALNAIDHSRDPLLDNIKSPIHATASELEALELDFAKLSKYQLRGTIAAGNGIVFWMQMPTYEEVEGDVTAYYTRKGSYCLWTSGMYFNLPPSHCHSLSNQSFFPH